MFKRLLAWLSRPVNKLTPSDLHALQAAEAKRQRKRERLSRESN